MRAFFAQRFKCLESWFCNQQLAACCVGKFSRRSTQLKVSRRFWLGDSSWLTSRSCVMLGTGWTSSSSLWREFSTSIINTVDAVTRIFSVGIFLPPLPSLSFLSLSLPSFPFPLSYSCREMPPQFQLRELGSAVSPQAGKTKAFAAEFSGKCMSPGNMSVLEAKLTYFCLTKSKIIKQNVVVSKTMYCMLPCSRLLNFE